VRSLRVPSHVPSHPQTTAKVRGFSPTASGFTAETDCLLEEGGFELAVPPRTERPWETQPGYHRDVEPETRTSRLAMPSAAFRSSGTEGSNPPSFRSESRANLSRLPSWVEIFAHARHVGHSAGYRLSLARPSDSEARHWQSLPTQCRPYSRLPLCMRFA
jgi:hypothetical protein